MLIGLIAMLLIIGAVIKPSTSFDTEISFKEMLVEKLEEDSQVPVFTSLGGKKRGSGKVPSLSGKLLKKFNRSVKLIH